MGMIQNINNYIVDYLRKLDDKLEMIFIDIQRSDACTQTGAWSDASTEANTAAWC